MDKKPLKVMILVNELLRGGAQKIVYDIACTIDRSLFDVHIVYLKNHLLFKADVKSLEEEIAGTGTRITAIGGKQKFSYQEFKTLRQLLAKEKPDILHTFLPYAGIVGRIAGRLAGVRHIVSTQCNLPLAYTAKVCWLDRLTLPLVSTWTGATEGIEDAYGKSIAHITEELWKAGRRHFTIVAGIDFETLYQTLAHTGRIGKRASLGIPDDAVIVMMTARLISWKGHDDLIDAMAYLAPLVHLLLVGWGPLEGALKARAEKLGVVSRVHFLGARTDVYELLAIADVYVQAHGYAPSGEVWKGPNTSQMEACAASVPSVSTHVPLIEYLIEDGVTGKLAKPNNPKDIARAITWVIGHPREAKILAATAKKRVQERYTTSAMVLQYQELYRLLME